MRSHWLLHNSNWAWERIHYYHHQYKEPSAFAQFAVHPVEAALQGPVGHFLVQLWFPVHPLQLAIMHAGVDVVAALCEAGADTNMNKSDTPDASPLWMALHARQDKMAAVLVKHGCHINTHDAARDNYTPLHVAVLDKDMFSARFLIDHGANPNDQDNNGRKSVLHLISEGGVTDLIQDIFLVRLRLDINLVDVNLQTAIHR